MDFDAVKDCLIQEANRAGLEEYEVYFMESSGMSTETLKNEISSFSSGVSGGVSFRCVVNGKMGSAATELFTEEEMKALVTRAMDGAKYIENEDRAILYAGAERYETVKVPESLIPDAAAVKKIALEIQERTYSESQWITDGTQSGVFCDQISMELMNSHGLHLSHRVSMSGAYAQAVIQKDGESQDAFDFTLNLDSDSLTAVSSRATQEALSKVGTVDISSGKYDVILGGKQMRSLLSAFSPIFSAKNAQLGLSLLKGREGELVANPIVTLMDDPLREDCPMQTAFDGEGVATRRKAVIKNGVLNTLLYDLATAYKAGVESTGNGQRVGYAENVTIRPYSFYLAGGTVSETELRETMGDGVYITELKGLHSGCNAVTGDFSIESAGYKVRNGKLCEAIKSFTIAGNFFELLKGIEGMANEVHFGIPSGFTVYGAPDVMIRQMSVAGK
ncbi:MAG: TldD/PmbA family protein [Clostridia bacterium]|nr:TldD/PmbA family protein [Clostridia bacterium]